MDRIIVIAASAGGLDPLCKIVAAVREACPSSVFIVVHIGDHPSDLPTILSWSSKLGVSFAQNGAPIEPSRVYVAPPDQHMVLEAGRIHLNRGPKVHHTRPAADPLFISAAEAYGNRVLGVVLSGGDKDGAEGLRVIKQHGGRVVVQKPEEAVDPSMPQTAIARDHPDACLSTEEIAKLMELCGSSSSPSGGR
jgi:two-component system, chemotaxis family, protein-glutamate methylesterase/glutaminase